LVIAKKSKLKTCCAGGLDEKRIEYREE